MRWVGGGPMAEEVEGVEFRLATSADVRLLAELFSDIDQTFFRPHPFTDDQARHIANQHGSDVYAILLDGQVPVAYGMLRGLEGSNAIPSLGIAVRTSSRGRGLGRQMMIHLHEEAQRREAAAIRLRVHHDNIPARRLYESLGYRYAGDERGELVMLLDFLGGASSRPASTPPAGMVVRMLDVDAPRWTSFLGETPHDFYHLPAYVALCAAHEQGEGCALYIENGADSLLLPLILRRIPGSGRRDATSPYGYPGPLVNGTADPGFQSAAMTAGLTALGEEGIVSVFVRLHPLLNASPPSGIGEIVLHGETVSIDLTLSQAARSAQMRHNHRRDIAKAVKHGLVARMDPEFARYDTFKRIYHETMARREATRYYQFYDDYFDALREALAGQLHLCVVEREGAVYAAGLFVETGGIVQYHLGGTDQALEALHPSKLMMAFVAEWAKQRGNRVLHLGGGVGGTSDSLHHFKAGFSPRRHAFRTLRVVTDEGGYARLVAANVAGGAVEQPWDFFPRYRFK